MTVPAETTPATGGGLRRIFANHEALKDYLTCVALLGAGAWSLFSFSSLQQRQRADAELALLRQDPVANIDLSVSDMRVTGQRDAAMLITAQIENVGRRSTTFMLGDAGPLTVMRLTLNDSGRIAEHSASTLAVLAIAADGNSVVQPPKTSLLPGERTRLHFLLPRAPAGVYLLQFSVPVATTNTPPTDWRWTARRIYVLCQGHEADTKRPAAPIVSAPRDTACAAQLDVPTRQ